MAPVDPLQRMMHDKRIREQDYPTWKQTFNPDLRYQQLDEDHHAWQSVTGTLLAIISIGVTLAVITVILCSAG
jgi:hypothetical protein